MSKRKDEEQGAHVGACLNCRQRKVRCDRLSPCGSCKQQNVPCVAGSAPIRAVAPSSQHKKPRCVDFGLPVVRREAASSSSFIGGSDIRMQDDEVVASGGSIECKFKPQTDACNLCAGGCGFFASATLDSYCSVCFKTIRGEEMYIIHMSKNTMQQEEDESTNTDKQDGDLSPTLGPDSDAAEEPQTITVAYSGGTYTGTVRNARKYEGAFHQGRMQGPEVFTASDGSSQGSAIGCDGAEDRVDVKGEDEQRAMQRAAAQAESRRSRIAHAHRVWVRDYVRGVDAPPHIARAWMCMHEYHLATWDEYTKRVGDTMSDSQWLTDMVTGGNSPKSVSDAYESIKAYKKMTYHPPDPPFY